MWGLSNGSSRPNALPPAFLSFSEVHNTNQLSSYYHDQGDRYIIEDVSTECNIRLDISNTRCVHVKRECRTKDKIIAMEYYQESSLVHAEVRGHREQ